MADIPYINQTLETKIVGQTSTGAQQNQVGADSNGNMLVKDFADGTSGTAVPSVTTQVGGTDGTNLRTITTDTSGNQKVVGNIASGTTDSGNGIKISGVFNTTVPSVSNGQRSDLQTDERGAIQTTPLDGCRDTFSVSVSGLTLAGSPTDILTIQGSATTTVRIIRIELNVSTTSGSGVLFNPTLVRRSAANTGGTTVTDTATSYDSNNSAPTAVVRHYTANATALGAAVGSGIRAARQAASNGSILGGSSGVGGIVWQFGDRSSQAVVLRGTSQFLALNLGGTAITGAVASLSIEWTEE